MNFNSDQERIAFGYFRDANNLDVIISEGYRVKSQRGVEFRQWANKVSSILFSRYRQMSGAR